eukprot:scaffold127505_cov33-Tisochrysis_lutea.AAC.2
MASGGCSFSPYSNAYDAATARCDPVGEKASADIDVLYRANWQRRFLRSPSHTLTKPSLPPVAKVPHVGW